MAQYFAEDAKKGDAFVAVAVLISLCCSYREWWSLHPSYPAVQPLLSNINRKLAKGAIGIASKYDTEVHGSPWEGLSTTHTGALTCSSGKYCGTPCSALPWQPLDHKDICLVWRKDFSDDPSYRSQARGPGKIQAVIRSGELAHS